MYYTNSLHHVYLELIITSQQNIVKSIWGRWLYANITPFYKMSLRIPGSWYLRGVQDQPHTLSGELCFAFCELRSLFSIEADRLGVWFSGRAPASHAQGPGFELQHLNKGKVSSNETLNATLSKNKYKYF